MAKKRKKNKKHGALRIFVAAIAVVMFWRGAWGILDKYFFPDNEILSYIVSILVAFIVLYIDDFRLKELE